MSNDNKPAAAQEAVVWVNGRHLEECKIMPMVESADEPGKMIPRNVAGSNRQDEYCDTPLYAAPVAAAPVELQRAARFAADVLAEIYTKYQIRIGPFASQAQLANAMLGAALRASPPAAPGIDLADVSLAAQMLTWGREEGLTESQIAEIDAHAHKLFARIDASPKGGSDAPKIGEVLVTVSGFTGSGKSAVAGAIEILCKALGLDVEWADSEEEKRLTHADWISDLELYKPRVRIVERNIPRPPMQATSAEVGS